jgi:hypothetical protein
MKRFLANLLFVLAIFGYTTNGFVVYVWEWQWPGFWVLVNVQPLV